jgi:hypothetical protein
VHGHINIYTKFTQNEGKVRNRKKGQGGKDGKLWKGRMGMPGRVGERS